MRLEPVHNLGGTVSFPGDLVKTVDNKGLVACLSYDGLHRVTSIIEHCII